MTNSSSNPYNNFTLEYLNGQKWTYLPFIFRSRYRESTFGKKFNNGLQNRANRISRIVTNLLGLKIDTSCCSFIHSKEFYSNKINDSDTTDPRLLIGNWRSLNTLWFYHYASQWNCIDLFANAKNCILKTCPSLYDSLNT